MELLKQFRAHCDVCGGADMIEGVHMTSFDINAVMVPFSSGCNRMI